MDWKEDIQTNLWVFPRGSKQDGAAGPNSPKWVSKYGSVIATGYDIGTADGMNEKGLVTSLLYLAESDYGQPDGKPPLSISVWAQYVLDHFATVAEAVAALRQEPFRLISMKLPNGSGAQLHLAISDATGDSAIFEYLDGKLVIHHGKQYQVMTNSPSYDQQLALNAYWESIGGLTFLPGTNRAADRFARASFLINAIPKTADPNYIKAVPGGNLCQSSRAQRAQRHAQCQRAPGYHHTRPAQHFVHGLAHRCRPEKFSLFLRFGHQPQCLLDSPNGA